MTDRRTDRRTPRDSKDCAVQIKRRASKMIAHKKIKFGENISPTMYSLKPHFRQEGQRSRSHRQTEFSNRRHAAIITHKTSAAEMTVDFDSVTVGFSNESVQKNVCLGFPKRVKARGYCYVQNFAIQNDRKHSPHG